VLYLVGTTSITGETANWCWTVIGGLLSFNARPDYETTTNNNRSRASGALVNP